MEELNPNPGSYGGTSVSPSEGTSGSRSEIPPRNISEIPPDGWSEIIEGKKFVSPSADPPNGTCESPSGNPPNGTCESPSGNPPNGTCESPTGNPPSKGLFAGISANPSEDRLPSVDHFGIDRTIHDSKPKVEDWLDEIEETPLDTTSNLHEDAPSWPNPPLEEVKSPHEELEVPRNTPSPETDLTRRETNLNTSIEDSTE